MSGIYGESGEVRIQRTLVAPERLLLRGAEAGTVWKLASSFMLGLFFLFYGGINNVEYWWFWLAIGIAWIALCVQTFRYARRLGSRGGYYPLIHSRTVRQQTRYPRSAHPSAPIRRTPDQGRM